MPSGIDDSVTTILEPEYTLWRIACPCVNWISLWRQSLEVLGCEQFAVAAWSLNLSVLYRSRTSIPSVESRCLPYVRCPIFEDYYKQVQITGHIVTALREVVTSEFDRL